MRKTRRTVTVTLSLELKLVEAIKRAAREEKASQPDMIKRLIRKGLGTCKPRGRAEYQRRMDLEIARALAARHPGLSIFPVDP